MRRRFHLLLVLFVLAAPAFARVVSYAPYTNQLARTGYHLRTSRYFPLIEGDVGRPQQLALYDSSGREEPRIIYTPPANSPAEILATAWHEGPTLATSFALATVAKPNSRETILSRDGGATWMPVPNLANRSWWSNDSIDDGGPWVHGLRGDIRIGTAQTPFVLRANDEVWAVRANGQADRLTTGVTAIIGQNRAGTAYLVQTQGGLYLLHLPESGSDAGRNFIRSVAMHEHVVRGWVTANDSVYVYDGRKVFLHAGPNDITEVFTRPTTHGLIVVPTHDFNGAWIADVSPQETSLWHHTPAEGRRQMWRDIAAPEIEALIAGGSGENLLIQVHRDRSIDLQQQFVDPALAVWRVGDPAPSEYDELYLNEQANKTFVHIDVDKVANGDPFVFDSGTFQMVDEGPISPPVGGGGDVIQEWGVVRGSLKQQLVLPGVARMRGAFNSNWMTDVTLYNPFSGWQDVEVQYAPLGVDVPAGAAQKKKLTLNPYEIRFIPDALNVLFGIENGGGALHFLPTDAINVFGRTYSSKDGGTFGFGMQAIDAMNAAGPRFPLTFAGAFPGENFRTNILLTDTSGRGTEVSLNAYGVSGALGESTRTVAAPVNGIFQLNGLGSTMGLFGRDSGGLIVQPTRGTAIATVVSIDNRTNDATYFPPDLATTVNRAIPVIGHLDGAHGAHFRSDIYLFNPSRRTHTVRLQAKQWDSPLNVTKQFTLLPNEARVIPDALSTLFGMSGLARLEYMTIDSEGMNDGVRVTSRTYTLEENGATYGSLIPPLNSFQVAGTGDTLEILGGGGGEGFRTNLGLVELSPFPNGPAVSVRIRIIGSEKKTTDSFIVEVPRAGGIQLGDIFTARGITAPTSALIVVEPLDAGLISAYATLTDNKTNDTTYLAANLGGKEE